MTHTSRANEDASGGVADNESLEFLGDAVLGFVIADMLFREFPKFDEGQKSKMKAGLVSTATLARQAERLALGDQLLLGRGEEKTGRTPQAGAAGRRVRGAHRGDVHRWRHRARARVRRPRVRPRCWPRSGEHGVVGHDYKSALQEYLQATRSSAARLSADRHGRPGSSEAVPSSKSGCEGEAVAEANGPSKKEAEQEAARLALERLSRASGA